MKKSLLVFSVLMASAVFAQPPHSGGAGQPKREEVKESARELRVKILDKLAKIEKLAMSPAADPTELKKLSDDLDRVLKGDIADVCVIPPVKKRDQKAADALRKSIQTLLAKSLQDTDALELALKLEPTIIDEDLYHFAFKILDKTEQTPDAIALAAKLSGDATTVDRMEMIKFAFAIYDKTLQSKDALTESLKLVSRLPRAVGVASFKERYDVYNKTLQSPDALAKALETFVPKKK